ncbi:MAG: T9SS type A sorting domain-containing protein [FCB group bacterium]|nr:T9SS type A sorting domain-containing protein [FCB group bacterium]
MQRSAIIFCWVLIQSLGAQVGLDSRYHTVPEIAAELDSLSQIPEYFDIFRVDTIGYSQQENIPILAGVISENVRVKEDEPRILFVGQVHAEEILGVEAVLKLMEDLLDPEPAQGLHATILRQNLEVWIVPTANPEGLNVVYAGLDFSYRKNKHDFSSDGPWPNGIFDFDPAIGNDIDGVDLNRNYDFNWIFGDGFMVQDGSSYGAHYDYYKGPAPFSESETKALRDLALERKFTFSIIFHSSRSGNFSEKVFTSWRWANGKISPDFDIMKSIGDRVADLTIKENGTGSYLSRVSTSRNGKAHDWFYTKTGCFQYLIECGTANLQPDSTLIEDTADRLQPAMYFLMDRAIGFQEDAAQVTGIVRDGSGGSPLSGVMVKILENDGRVLAPRLTDEFGRYRRIMAPGSYELQFSAAGYASQTFSVTTNNSAITRLNVDLMPVPEYSVFLTLIPDPGFSLTDFPVLIKQDGWNSDTLNVGFGTTELTLSEGLWAFTILDSGAKPWYRQIYLQSDTVINVGINSPDIVRTLDFNAASDWQLWTGPWITHGDTLKSQSAWLYSNQDSTETQFQILSQAIEFTGSQSLTLVIDHRFELEWDVDTVSVTLEDTVGHILAQKWWTDQSWNRFRKSYLMITDSAGISPVRIRLRFDRDGSVNYRGWEIGGLTLYAGMDPWLGVQSSPVIQTALPKFRLSNLFPNPTSGGVSFFLTPGKDPVQLRVFNLLGQEIYRETFPPLSPGRQQLYLNFRNLQKGKLGSGVYFVKLEDPHQTVIKRCIYLKN